VRAGQVVTVGRASYELARPGCTGGACDRATPWQAYRLTATGERRWSMTECVDVAGLDAE